MASLAQYQSFALIAYEAVKQQTLYINSEVAKGCSDNGCTETIYLAKNINDVVFNYSMGCSGTEDMLESDILTMCDWLMSTLCFTIPKPIAQLEGTDLNTY